MVNDRGSWCYARSNCLLVCTWSGKDKRSLCGTNCDEICTWLGVIAPKWNRSTRAVWTVQTYVQLAFDDDELRNRVCYRLQSSGNMRVIWFYLYCFWKQKHIRTPNTWKKIAWFVRFNLFLWIAELRKASADMHTAKLQNQTDACSRICVWETSLRGICFWTSCVKHIGNGISYGP